MLLPPRATPLVKNINYVGGKRYGWVEIFENLREGAKERKGREILDWSKSSFGFFCKKPSNMIERKRKNKITIKYTFIGDLSQMMILHNKKMTNFLI